MTRMRVVTVAAGLVVAALTSALPAHAAHDAAIAACLKTETGAKRDAHSCIGRAADACANTPDGQSTVGESKCALDEADAWDAMLNEEYAELLKLLKPDAAEDLRNAQRTWISSRDADCRVPYHFYDGGSIVQILGARCMLDRTAERALLLRSWLQMARGEDVPSGTAP